MFTGLIWEIIFYNGSWSETQTGSHLTVKLHVSVFVLAQLCCDVWLNICFIKQSKLLVSLMLLGQPWV